MYVFLSAGWVCTGGKTAPLLHPNTQVGLTDATQYEHRVGRTGRAGKTGLALLMLTDDEERLLPMLGGFPLAPAGTSSAITGGLSSGAAGLPVPPPLARAYGECGREGELKASADKAFVATLGFLAGEKERLTACPGVSPGLWGAAGQAAAALLGRLLVVCSAHGLFCDEACCARLRRARLVRGRGREGELKASADKAFVATLTFLAGGSSHVCRKRTPRCLGAVDVAKLGIHTCILTSCTSSH